MRTRLTAAAFVLTFAALMGAAPANAASPTPISEQPSAAVVASLETQLTPAPNVVHPNYAAGAHYYVCVSPNGSTTTVLYQQSTVQTCRGAAAIQVYLESGQFVKTVQLTTAGKPATGHFTPGSDCLLAILGGGVGLIFTAKDESLILTIPVAVGIAGHYCYSA